MGQKPKTTVEINGKQYDAITGQPVADAPVPEQNSQPTNEIRSSSESTTGGSLDGVTKPQAAHSNQVHSSQRKGHSLHRTAARTSSPRPASPESTHDEAHDEQPAPARRQLAQNVDKSREERSTKHVKSTAIAKFSTGSPQAAEAEVAPLTVPEGEPNKTQAISTKDQLIAQQLAKTAASQPADEPKPKLKDRVKDKLKNGRTSSVIAASLAGVLLIGYVTYLNIPRMALRVASGRAGFSAELPGYAPSGFRFNGPVSYSPGELTLKYTSNTDERYYQITEQETVWDSQTLLDNYVQQETDLYSTYQQRGLTIYLFDGSNATWINGGIWYTVSGDSQLTSEQLLKIAASL